MVRPKSYIPKVQKIWQRRRSFKGSTWDKKKKPGLVHNFTRQDCIFISIGQTCVTGMHIGVAHCESAVKNNDKRRRCGALALPDGMVSGILRCGRLSRVHCLHQLRPLLAVEPNRADGCRWTPILQYCSRHVWPGCGIGCTCGTAASGHHMRMVPLPRCTFALPYSDWSGGQRRTEVE